MNWRLRFTAVRCNLLRPRVLHPVDVGHKLFSFPRCWNGKWLVVQYLGCVRLGNLDLDFNIRISDFNAEKSVFGFPFYRSIGQSEKGLKLTVLKNSGLARARIISEKRPLLTRTVLQILFRISQSNGKEEIHEIRIWISKLKSTLRTDFSKVKSENEFRVRLQNPKSNSGFPNWRQPYIRLASSEKTSSLSQRLGTVVITAFWIMIFDV